MPEFTSQGLRIQYREGGKGDLMLVLHGSTASSVHHQGEMAYFGERFHVVAMDNPGNGKSQRLEEWGQDYWDLCAVTAAELIEHLGGAPAWVIGCSGGGIIALLLAAMYPHLVRAVVADSMVLWLPEDEVRAEMATRDHPTPEQVAFWKAAHGEDWQRVVRQDTAFLLGLGERMADVYGGKLPQVRCPVLLTASLGDDLVPAPGEQVLGMMRQIQDCRAYLTNRGGHPLMWSRPELFRHAVDGFLAEVAGR